MLFFGILELITPKPANSDLSIPVQVVKFVPLVREEQEPRLVLRRQLPKPPEFPQRPLPEAPQAFRPAPVGDEVPASATPLPGTVSPLNDTRSLAQDRPNPPQNPSKPKAIASQQTGTTTPANPITPAAATPPARIPAKAESAETAPAEAPLRTMRDPTPTHRVKPRYPKLALRTGIEGRVSVEFTITETGLVESPTIVSAKPPRIFDKAVLKAVLKWRFEPYVVAGRAVPTQAVQEFRFSLNDR